MDKNYFIQLTTNLYRLTLLFPKKEPLRYKMRELADEILANLTLILSGDLHRSKNLISETEKNLEILDSFFEIAKAQNWLSPFDILEIQNEYSKMREEIEKFKEFKEIEKDSFSQKRTSINERQEKILEILKEREKVQVGQLVSVFPGVSKRTLRRDFQALFRSGLIERLGEKNNTFYQLKIGQIGQKCPNPQIHKSKKVGFCKTYRACGDPISACFPT